MTTITPAPLQTVTEHFLDHLVDRDLDAALSVIDDRIVYTNVGLPTVRGKKRFGAIMRTLVTTSTRFDYRMINAAADDGVVLTERIDQISVGRLRLQFWVCGRFEVRDGVITLWRDYFDFYDCTKAFARGVVGLVVPKVVPQLH